MEHPTVNEVRWHWVSNMTANKKNITEMLSLSDVETLTCKEEAYTNQMEK